MQIDTQYNKDEKKPTPKNVFHSSECTLGFSQRVKKCRSTASLISVYTKRVARNLLMMKSFFSSPMGGSDSQSCRQFSLVFSLLTSQRTRRKTNRIKKTTTISIFFLLPQKTLGFPQFFFWSKSIDMCYDCYQMQRCKFFFLVFHQSDNFWEGSTPVFFHYSK